MPQAAVEMARESWSSGPGEEQLDSVIRMASGMAPIIELTGSHVLERHPNLRFIVTESECGWLAWVLEAMDRMQERPPLWTP